MFENKIEIKVMSYAQVDGKCPLCDKLFKLDHFKKLSKGEIINININCGACSTSIAIKIENGIGIIDENKY